MLNTRSYSLIRTNPKFSGNVRLMVDSRGQIFLESFDANATLKLNRFKKFMVSPKSNYGYDLFKFFDNGATPANIVYDLFRENDDRIIFNKFNEQFEMQYNFGTKELVSNQYDEVFSIFAPLWVNEGNIPKKFVIFSLDGAINNTEQPNNDALLDGVSYRVISDASYVISYGGVEYSTGSIVKGTSLSGTTYKIISGSGSVVIDDPNLAYNNSINAQNIFNENIDKAKILKVIDLSENSSIGQYLRNSTNDGLIPNTPLFVDFQNKFIEYRGINYQTGVYSSSKESMDTDVESPIFTLDKNVSSGFERNSLIIANLFNLEFAFDDDAADEYTFNRYFGFYCDDLDMANFKIDGYKTFDSVAGIYKDPYFNNPSVDQ